MLLDLYIVVWLVSFVMWVCFFRESRKIVGVCVILTMVSFNGIVELELVLCILGFLW